MELKPRFENVAFNLEESLVLNPDLKNFIAWWEPEKVVNYLKYWLIITSQELINLINTLRLTWVNIWVLSRGNEALIWDVLKRYWISTEGIQTIWSVNDNVNLYPNLSTPFIFSNVDRYYSNAWVYVWWNIQDVISTYEQGIKLILTSWWNFPTSKEQKWVIPDKAFHVVWIAKEISDLFNQLLIDQDDHSIIEWLRNYGVAHACDFFTVPQRNEFLWHLDSTSLSYHLYNIKRRIANIPETTSPLDAVRLFRNQLELLLPDDIIQFENDDPFYVIPIQSSNIEKPWQNQIAWLMSHFINYKRKNAVLKVWTLSRWSGLNQRNRSLSEQYRSFLLRAAEKSEYNWSNILVVDDVTTDWTQMEASFRHIIQYFRPRFLNWLVLWKTVKWDRYHEFTWKINAWEVAHDLIHKRFF